MGKLFLLLVPLLLLGCEQTFDNLIDTSSENYQLTAVYGIKDTVDLKVPGDSLFSPRLVFSSQSVINKVYFDLYASDNTLLNSSPVQMQEVSTKTYQGSFILHRQDPIGKYNVKFSVTGFDGINKEVASSSFYFNNGQDNVPPVISNLIMPDSVQAGGTILYTVEVSDSNGLSDVESVFYEVYNPDGIKVVNSQGISEFPMFDDGNTQENGDVTAGDGIYTVVLTFPVSAQTGTWRFEFQARDRSKTLSNKIIHNIVVL
ncbi:MAG: hypothetical protein P8X47_12105 [Ignavibacteriaceae bacterium]